MIAQSDSTRKLSLSTARHGRASLCEKLIQYDTDRRFRIVTFCEEPRAAYDRVG